MNAIDEDWEKRIAGLWLAFNQYPPEAFVALVDAMVEELPVGSAVGHFEQGCALDSTGHPDLAVRHYQAALEIGLTGVRRRRAVIQMSSSFRNLGDPSKALTLLAAELAAPSDELDGAVRAVLALALVDVGREREAVAHCLVALAKYLPRYNRSMARYAQQVAVVAP